MNVISSICNLYDADGLYAIDSNAHSPLIGFAYDGFPIYGAYGFKNANGTGGITRIKSGYSKRNITVRTEYADGTNVDDGPPVSATYFLGYFREDYEFIPNAAEDYLDEHNGRFCVTPEYPNGTYAYFCTVDENWNSAYPYAVGPTFYGVHANRLVTSINEPTMVYDGTGSVSQVDVNALNISLFPNPASDLIAIQVNGLTTTDLTIELIDLSGKVVKTAQINKGQTISYFDVQAVYEGSYVIKISNGDSFSVHKIAIKH